ncbi:hypothetical protein HPB48_011082 [Haemaphysalis longicornis]|uniref:Uncharacterized protein n=1 Tax=Haemaphysalis longicornis TaxID=44386 RepID=A0A9J6GRE8_HAELO|nr:hypothetical protein HPB48_011082 [Haemaphysalis longicornis]
MRRARRPWRIDPVAFKDHREFDELKETFPPAPSELACWFDMSYVGGKPRQLPKLPGGLAIHLPPPFPPGSVCLSLNCLKQEQKATDDRLKALLRSQQLPKQK